MKDVEIMGGIGLLIGLANSVMIKIPETKVELIQIYKKYESDDVPWQLLRAVAIVESSENYLAFNPNDPSYGLMQILWTGNNRLNVDGWPPPDLGALYDPEYNVRIGSQILAWNIAKYGWFRGIIVYNNWSARKGKIPLTSIKYYGKVYSTYLRLKSEF